MAFQSAKRDLRKRLRETFSKLSATSINQQCLSFFFCLECLLLTSHSQGRNQQAPVAVRIPECKEHRGLLVDADRRALDHENRAGCIAAR